MKCPHCGKSEQMAIPEVLYINCENYGSNIYTVACQNCDKVLDVCARRTVRIISINKSNKKRNETDWP